MDAGGAHLHRCVAAGLAACTDVPDVLFKLLQTVQHGLSEQLASPGCSSHTAFTWDGPQLLHTRAQPGQVPTHLLQVVETADTEK